MQVWVVRDGSGGGRCALYGVFSTLATAVAVTQGLTDFIIAQADIDGEVHDLCEEEGCLESSFAMGRKSYPGMIMGMLMCKKHLEASFRDE
jgi:hypothetical protein